MKTLETERLILREWLASDEEDMFAYAKDPEVGPNAGWEPHADIGVSGKVIQMFMKENDVWAIECKENSKVIGSIGLHCDKRRPEGVNVKMLGYVLSKDYWGRGLMTEAADRVIQFAFEELNVELLSVYHYPFNERSRRVIEKCGFTFEGKIRQASSIYNGRIYDDVCYSMTRGEYHDRNERTGEQ